MKYGSTEYLLLLSPIVLGLGSAAFIDNKKYPNLPLFLPGYLALFGQFYIYY